MGVKVKMFKIKDKQEGIVSIIVTLIIMIVLTLIVTGFAQLARNERREALDRELGTQAFYAVESGVNAARALVTTQLALPDTDPNKFRNYKDDCSAGITAVGDTLEPSNNAAPTCILINKTPETLVVQNVLTNRSTILPIEQGGGGLDDLTISWENVNGANNNPIRYSSLPVAPSPIFLSSGDPTSTNWGSASVGVLRIDLVPVDSLNPNDLRERMFTAFLVPTSSDPNANNTFSYASASTLLNQGKIIPAKCDGPPTSKKKCAVKIDGLGSYTKYYLRMKSIYNSSDVVICPSQGFNCQTGETLIKAQTVIDVTAKATDVLKRVQVRVNTDPNASSSYSFPEYTLDSAESICKLLTVTPTTTSEPACP